MNDKVKLLALKILFLLCLCSLCVSQVEAQPSAQELHKQRLIVLTDISYMEPDDAQSLTRLLLYSNQIDIEGLIATTNNVKRDLSPEIIRRTIGVYAKVRENLLLHESGFPEAEALLQVVKEGLPLYGMEGVGSGKDSEGIA